MKKIIQKFVVAIALASILLTGCGQGTVETVPDTTQVFTKSEEQNISIQNIVEEKNNETGKPKEKEVLTADTSDKDEKNTTALNEASKDENTADEPKEETKEDTEEEPKVETEAETKEETKVETKEVQETQYCKDIHGTYGYEEGFFVDLKSLQELDDCYQMEMYVTWSYTGDTSAPMDVIRIEKNAPATLFPLDAIQSGFWTGGSNTTFSTVVSEHPGGKIWMCDIETGANGYITSITTLTVSG